MRQPVLGSFLFSKLNSCRKGDFVPGIYAGSSIALYFARWQDASYRDSNKRDQAGAAAA